MDNLIIEFRKLFSLYHKSLGLVIQSLWLRFTLSPQNISRIKTYPSLQTKKKKNQTLRIDQRNLNSHIIIIFFIISLVLIKGTPPKNLKTTTTTTPRIVQTRERRGEEKWLRFHIWPLWAPTSAMDYSSFLAISVISFVKSSIASTLAIFRSSSFLFIFL